MKQYLFFALTSFALVFSSCDTIQKTQLAEEKNNEAIEHMNAGEFDLAIAALRVAVNANVFDNGLRSTFCRNLAIAFQQSEQLDSARVYFLRAADEAELGTAQKELNAADVCLIDNNITEAIEHLNKANIAGGEELGVNNTLGIIYMGEYGFEYQDLGLAIKYNELAYKEDQSRATLDVLARTYYEADSLKEAQIHFSDLVSNYPQFADYHYMLGATEYEMANFETAEMHFANAIQIDPIYGDFINQYYEIMSWSLEDTTYSDFEELEAYDSEE
jgi:tetratricopeptide (TPR) repeat protein